MQAPGFPYVFLPPHGYPMPVAHPPGTPVYYVPGMPPPPPPPESAAFPGFSAVYPVQYVHAAAPPPPPPQPGKADADGKAPEPQAVRPEAGAVQMALHPYAYHPYPMPHPPPAPVYLAAPPAEAISHAATTALSAATAAVTSQQTAAKPREAITTVSTVAAGSAASNGVAATAPKPAVVHLSAVPGHAPPPQPTAPPVGYPYPYYPPVQAPYYMSARPPPSLPKPVPTTTATAAAAARNEHSRPMFAQLPLAWLQHNSPDPAKLLATKLPPPPPTHQQMQQAHAALQQQLQQLQHQQQQQASGSPTSTSPTQDGAADGDGVAARHKWSQEAVAALERLVGSYEGTEIKRDDFYENVQNELEVLGYSHTKRAIQTKIGMLALLNKVKIKFTWTDEEDKAAMSRLTRSTDYGAILQQLKARGLCVGRTLQDFEKRCREHYLPLLRERTEQQDGDPEKQPLMELGELRLPQPGVRHMREWTPEEEAGVTEAVKPYLANNEQINWHAVREELNKRGLCLDRTENAIACHFRKTPRKRKRTTMRIPVQFHTDEELLKKQRQIRKQLFSTPSEVTDNDGAEGSAQDNESESEELQHAVTVQEESEDPWTTEEDEALLELILASHPPYDWRDILAKMQDRGFAAKRSTRQILHRYCHHYQREVTGGGESIWGRDLQAVQLSRSGELVKLDITETLSVMASTKLQRGKKPIFPTVPSTNALDSGMIAAQTIINGLSLDQSSPPPKEIVGMALVLGWTYHVPTASTSLPIDKTKRTGVWVRSDVACESITAAAAKKGFSFFETNEEFVNYLKRLYPTAPALSRPAMAPTTTTTATATVPPTADTAGTATAPATSST